MAWHQYLLGHKFTIITDQQSLKRLQDRPGPQNNAADPRSRVPPGHLLAFSAPVPSLLQDLATTMQSDSTLADLLQHITIDPTQYPNYTLKDGFLLFEDCIVIPNNLALRQQLLTEMHTSNFGGHSGVTRTINGSLLLSIGPTCVRMLSNLLPNA